MRAIFVFLTLLCCKSIAFATTDVCSKESSIKDALERDFKKACSDITVIDLKSLAELAVNPATSNHRIYQAKDFEGLENLKRLFFYQPYQEFAEGAFDRLTAIEVLVIQPSQLAQGLFKKLKSLRRLSIVGAFTDLPSNLFDENSSLQELLIIGQLTAVPAHAFDKLPNLEKLNLSWNRISNLSSRVFAYNTKLKILDLSRNELQTFPIDVFNNLSELRALCLYFNPMESLKMGMFANLKELEQLRLTPLQGFVSFEEGVFSNLSSLKFLTLRLSPKFNYLPEGVFGNGNFNSQAYVYFLNDITDLDEPTQKSIKSDLGTRADFTFLLSEDHWTCGGNPN